MQEVWKDIPDYEEFYEVSNTGKVYSKRRKRLLTLSDNGYGYLLAPLSKNGETKWARVHILVLLAFIGEPPAGCEVNHINGDKKDNRLENLEYITSSQNQ